MSFPKPETRKLVVALALLTLIGLAGPEVLALDRAGNPLMISPPGKTADEKEYGPLVGNNPAAHDIEDKDGQNITIRPDHCRLATTCDTVPIILEVPPANYRLIVTISWEVQNVEDVYAVPDIDVYLWEERTNREGQLEWGVAGTSSSAGMPEVIKLADLAPTSKTLGYYLTPLNWAGEPTNYTVKVEYFLSTRPERRSSTTSRPTFPSEGISKAQAQAIKAAQGSAEPPAEILEPVKFPGPDGELVEMTLTNIRGEAAGRQEDRTPLVLGVIVLLAFAGGTFLFFFIRNRRQTAT